jgi:hypothetical protein
MIRRLIVPFAVAIVTLHAGQGFAQGAFPAPLPGQTGAANASPFPPQRRRLPLERRLLPVRFHLPVRRRSRTRLWQRPRRKPGPTIA